MAPPPHHALLSPPCWAMLIAVAALAGAGGAFAVLATRLDDTAVQVRPTTGRVDRQPGSGTGDTVTVPVGGAVTLTGDAAGEQVDVTVAQVQDPLVYPVPIESPSTQRPGFAKAGRWPWPP